MGKSAAYTFIVEYWNNGRPQDVTICGWDNGHSPYAHGRPTKANLKRYIDGLRNSISVGGVNAHLIGRINLPDEARIVRQSNGEVVAEYRYHA